LDVPKFNRQNHFFQTNYYDRMIRDENEYYRITDYIQKNPLKWKEDDDYISLSHIPSLSTTQSPSDMLSSHT
jgi:hypothetical protein